MKLSLLLWLSLTVWVSIVRVLPMWLCNPKNTRRMAQKTYVPGKPSECSLRGRPSQEALLSTTGFFCSCSCSRARLSIMWCALLHLHCYKPIVLAIVAEPHGREVAPSELCNDSVAHVVGLPYSYLMIATLPVSAREYHKERSQIDPPGGSHRQSFLNSL